MSALLKNYVGYKNRVASCMERKYVELFESAIYIKLTICAKGVIPMVQDSNHCNSGQNSRRNVSLATAVVH